MRNGSLEPHLLIRLAASTDELPTLPTVARKILNLGEQKLSGARELAEVVMMDPALAAKVLRVANSSLYGLKAEVRTISHAISLLGFNVIKNMVLGLSIFEALKEELGNGALDHHALWEHLLGCAMFSKAVAEKTRSKKTMHKRAASDGEPKYSGFFRPDISEIAFLGGLLHDIGKLLLDRYCPVEYRMIIKRAWSNQEDLWDLERELLGLTHTDIGDWLAQHWRLPAIHRSCIRLHHFIPPRERNSASEALKISFIVAGSDFFTRLFDIGKSGNPWLQMPLSRFWEFLPVGPKLYEETLLPTIDRMEEAKEAFGLPGKDTPALSIPQKVLEKIKGKGLLLSQASPRPIDPVSMVLRHLEIQYEMAKTGRDLIEKTTSAKPELVIIDLCGYRVNWVGFIRYLRQLKQVGAGEILLLGLEGCEYGKDHKELLEHAIHFSSLPSVSRMSDFLSKIFDEDGERLELRKIPAEEKSKKTKGFTEADLFQRENGGLVDVQPWQRRLTHKTRYLGLQRTDTDLPISPGTIINGKYEVIKHLKRGGMADIYKVRCIGDDGYYALKLLPLPFHRDRRMVQRFRQEALKGRQMNHPNVAKLLDYNEDSMYHYMVMELATGWDIRDGFICHDVGELPKPLGIEISLMIISQACMGLHYIHSQGLIHRDIKPQNLLLFDNRIIKLSDFGIARCPDSLSLTMTGVPIGTPEYMSPEQIEGKKEITAASDIYALGIVMYEMLTGKSPYRRKTSLATMMAHLQEDPLPPRKWNPAIPEEIEDIIMKCLNKAQNKRFLSAEECRLAIERR